MPEEQDFYRSVVAALAERRRALGITQADLDDRLGVSDGMVSRWERGVKLPGPFFFVCWAQTLGLRLVPVPQESR